ncbi:MAG: AAA family ATPase, partial [Anaerolineaceae bacterium]
QRPVFIGRKRELTQLDGFLEKALAGQGQVVFVTGGAGRGKTALADEFCRRSQETHTDLIVARGNCNAHTGVRDPYLPFRDVFGMLTGDVERLWTAGAITREHAKRLWELLPLILPALLDHGSSLIDILVPGKALLSRARVAHPGYNESLSQLEGVLGRKKTGISELEQSHLFEQCTNVLRDLAEHNPLTLVLDDFQWADNASIDLMFHLGRRLEGCRILIIGAYRTEVVALGRDDDRHPLESVVNELKGKLGDITIDLGIEDEAEGSEFVSSFLDSEPNQFSADFRQALYEHTGGHPLFTIELLRAMQERGDIIKDEEGKWLEGPSLAWDALPARVEAVIEERIGRLEKNLREALSIASVEGEDFTVQVISRIQDIHERRLLRELSQELERRHRLVREQEELKVNGLRLSRYRFVHQLLQRYLYNNLSAGERRLLHGEIASVLEDLFEDYSDQIAVQLSFHYGQAGNAEKELHYQIQAGNQVLDSYAHKEAETYYRRALELVESDTDRAEILSGLGEALFGQSRFIDAIDTWREGIDKYQTLGSEGINGMARLYARSARAASNAGDPPGGLKLCQEGLEATEDASESYEMALLVHEAGRAYFFNGFPEEAEIHCGKALDMSERLGVVDVQADTLATYGVLPGIPPDEALGALEKAVEIAETAGLQGIAWRAYNNMGVIKNTLFSDIRGSLDDYLRSVELANRIGATDNELFALTNVLGVLRSLGDYAAVEEALPDYEQLMSTISDPMVAEWNLRHAKAELLINRGQWEEALQLLRTSQTEAHQRGDLQSLSNVSFDLADRLVNLHRVGEPVDLNEAEDGLIKVIEISDRGLGSRVEPRCQLSMVHAHKGEFDNAHLLLTEAKEAAGSTPTIANEAWLVLAAGDLAFLEKRWAEALVAFEEIAGILERLELRPPSKMALIFWADVLIARGQLADSERAEALLQDAKSAFEEMGAPYFVGIIEKKLEGLQTEAEK